MTLSRKPMRYAHPEGHTDVCYYTGSKGGLLTCGTDGDVRFWLNLMDDDPAASCIAEQVIALASKKDKIYVSTDNNTVQILTFPDLDKEGIITRFAATVCPLATSRNSKYIVSGACDMRIQVSDAETSDSIELVGHQGPILGLTLDPREEYVASSSTDGTIRVWNLKDRGIVQIWNHVPKTNSFFAAKTYCTPSFHCVDGRFLAFPRNKDVVVVERGTWKELFKLRCNELKSELSICKFSECGTLLAASSLHGEIVVWQLESKEVVGYSPHERDTRITSFAWSLDKPSEIAFCDYFGMLGCIDVEVDAVERNDQQSDVAELVDGEDLDDIVENYKEPDDDDGISLNKINAADVEDDIEDAIDDDVRSTVQAVTQIHLQKPFQPGSSPEHLLSRYMVWNDTGIVKCYLSEDGEDSSIDVEFHDSSLHHALHMSNYLQHTMAALSDQALALACPSNADAPSKFVVISMQGWGSGNKEWSVELEYGESALCVAAGDNFVAVVTSRRNLRLFTPCGTQREVIALPGPPVTMNGFRHHLVVVYHSGLASREDQYMKMLWIRIRGLSLRNDTLSVPLAPESHLTWTGLTDLGSPVIMDSEGVLRIYENASSLWKVACNTDSLCKGKSDHYFLISVNESQKIAKGVSCKGSYYPPTTPRPISTEIPLVMPLCNLENDQSQKEAELWQVGRNPRAEKEILLGLFALACRRNAEYRAVELCEHFLSEKVLDLAIKYANRLGRSALVNKLQSVVETKDEQPESIDYEEEIKNETKRNMEAEENLLLSQPKENTEFEIRPLTLSMRKSNPFKVAEQARSPKDLSALNRREEPVPKSSPTPSSPLVVKSKTKSKPARESFVAWYGKNKQRLKEEYPALTDKEITTKALVLYKEEEKAVVETDQPKVKESFLFWFGKAKVRLREEFPSLNDKELMSKAMAMYKNQEKYDEKDTPSEVQQSKKRKYADPEERSPKSSAKKLAAFASNDE